MTPPVEPSAFGPGASDAGASGAGASGAVGSGVPAARCAGVTKSYLSLGGSVQALTGVDAEFPRHAVTVLVGPSGAGKSTLLRLLACLDRPDDGRVEIDGEDVSRLGVRARRAIRRRNIGYVLQDPAANLVEYLTAEQHLRLAGQLAGAPRGGRGTSGTARGGRGGSGAVRDGHGTSGEPDLLDVLGLAQRRTALPRTLSGGEQQRLAFAFAAAAQPAVLIADEPTAELDSVSGEAVIEALRTLADRGTAVIVASHDDLVVDAADRVLTVDQGEVQLTSG